MSDTKCPRCKTEDCPGEGRGASDAFWREQPDYCVLADIACSLRALTQPCLCEWDNAAVAVDPGGICPRHA